MPNRTSCQIHIPHKANMQDWASQLAHLLFPGDPVKAAELGNLARADHENWEALERFLNQIAPNCFGGEGCGTPSLNLTVPNGNVVDGEDSCAEGRDNTVHGDKSTVIAGINNENDGENSTISGESNTITIGLDSAIIGGSTNTIGSGSENVINGGDNNAINSTACVIDASTFSTLADSTNVAIVGGDTCADDSQDAQHAGLVTGLGGVIWDQLPSLVLGLATGTFTTATNRIRPFAQYQVTGQGNFPTPDATPVDALVLAILESDSLFRVSGTILARQTDADVASVWSFDMVISSTTASGARFVGTSPHITLIDQDVGAAAWATAITIDPPAGVFNSVKFTVTGDAAHEVEWSVRLTIDEEYTGN